MLCCYPECTTPLEQLPDDEQLTQSFGTPFRKVRTDFGESQSTGNNLQQETGSHFKARAVKSLKVCLAAKSNRKHKYLYSFVTKEPCGFWQKDLLMALVALQ